MDGILGPTVAAAALACLLLVLVPTANASTLDGQLVVASCGFIGESFVEGEFYALHVPASQTGPSGLRLEVRARSMDVVEAYATGLRAGDGTPMVTGSGAQRATFGETSGATLAVDAGSEILVTPQAGGGSSGGAFTLNRPGGLLAVDNDPEPRLSFERRWQGPASDAAVGFSFARAAATPRLGVATGDVSFQAQGDLVVHLYGIDLQLETDGGRKVFRSGASNGLGGLEGRQQVLRLDLHDATVRIHLQDRAASLHAGAATVRGQGVLALADAEGPLRRDGREILLAHEDLEIAGDTRVFVAAGGAKGPSLPLRVSTVGAIVRGPDFGPFEGEESVSSMPWLGAAGVGFLVLVGAALRMGRRSRAARAAYHARLAEILLLRGDRASATMEVQAALDADAAQATSLVTRAILLVQERRDAEALRFAGEAVDRAPGAGGVLAYLAAVAATRLGMTDEAARWLARAVDREPRLARDAESNPLFDDLRRDGAPALVRAGLRPSPAASEAYA